MTDVATEHLVPDLVDVAVPLGGRVLVCSDLHLGERADAATEHVAASIARAIGERPGPGVVILDGDCFELLGERHRDPARALAAHPRLSAALRDFAAGPNRRVVVVAGNHDGALAWQTSAATALRRQIGAEVALAVDLCFDTGGGPVRVRVEHGHQLDPANSFVDPRDPGETPLGHHVVTDLLPQLRRPDARWIEGIDLLGDPNDTLPVIASRLWYRRIARWVGALVLPIVAGVAMLVVRAAGGPAGLASVGRTTLLAGAVLVAAVLVGGAWWAAVLSRPLGALRPDLSGGAAPGNDAPRMRARRLATEGYVGYVSGHTHDPELTDLGGAFYANTGCGGHLLHRRPGRLGLPPAFSRARMVSWLELEAGAQLRSALHVGYQEVPSTTVLERLCTKPAPLSGARPVAVALWPDGESWPPRPEVWRRRQRIRRAAAAVLAGAGVLDIVSAVTPPLRSRLLYVEDVVPLAVSQAAAVLTVLSGIALVLLARGVRRGQRHAWTVAVALLVASVALHIVKGFDLEEGVAAGVIAAWLAAVHDHFAVRPDRVATRRGLGTLLFGALAAVAAGVAATEAFSGHVRRPTVRLALQAVTERMVGVRSTALPLRIDRFLAPTLLATSVGLVVAAGWLLFQPVLAHRLPNRPPEAEEQARRLVAAHGGDTLSYFALRADKLWFFFGDTLVAYAVHQGVCLVSPDPIGPVAERWQAWAAFRRFADDHGWPVAVLGASEAWLPVYRGSGMHDLYVGDEAVVDVRRFSLEGGRNKGLRQAVNRIANKGYSIEFHDPAKLPSDLERELRALMGESRRGQVERGFSMTLSRVFDPADEGLLLAVCIGPDGRPAAFCHYVPAPGIRGWSLDLMRRSEGDHPNGLTDFVVVRTIEHLREQGMVGLGLNFSVMRSVLAGERGDRTTVRVQRWLLRRMSDSMQIESLWRFNAKFDPDWVPRYAVFDAPEHLLAAAVAVAQAESFWELPVVGRFLKPKQPEPEPEAETACLPDGGALEAPSGDPVRTSPLP